jgi:hypothetical protein
LNMVPHTLLQHLRCIARGDHEVSFAAISWILWTSERDQLGREHSRPHVKQQHCKLEA